MTLRPHVLEIERTEDATDEARQLLAELDQALAGNYLPEQHHALSLEQLFRTNVRFFVARADGVAVGCGGVAFYDGFAEVKRMYTDRGLGGSVSRPASCAGLRQRPGGAATRSSGSRPGGITPTRRLPCGRRRRVPAPRALDPLRVAWAQIWPSDAPVNSAR